MTDRKNPDAERKKAWKHARDSVHAYAQNPCAATEVDVKAAVAEVRHLQDPCQPAPAKKNKKARKTQP